MCLHDLKKSKAARALSRLRRKPPKRLPVRPNFALAPLAPRGLPPCLQTECQTRVERHPKNGFGGTRERVSSPEPRARTAAPVRRLRWRWKKSVCAEEADGGETRRA